MRLRSRILRVSGRLKSPFANARNRWEARAGALLVLEAEDGGWGQGECAPLPGFSPDGDEAIGELEGLGDLQIDPEAPLEALPTQSAAASAALECAVLDLVARRRQIGLAALLGGGQPRSISALLDAPPGPETLLAARSAWEAGFETMKWKAGRPGRWPEELETVRALRAALPEARIRLDINQGWNFDEATERLALLAPLRLELVEEPCPPPFPEVPVPLGADESLLLPEGLDRAGPALRALVLKPMALGGARATLRQAAQAQRRGLAVVVSHLLEGPVGLAFACEIAAALPGEVWACGLAPHAGLSAWPALAVPQIQGSRLVPARSGLGLPRLDRALELP